MGRLTKHELDDSNQIRIRTEWELTQPAHAFAVSQSEQSEMSPIAQRLEVMSRLQQPVWVFDIDQARIIWCNPSCLEIWQAESVQELSSRDMRKDMSEAVAKRLNQFQTDFQKDQTVTFHEVWTFFPRGKPATYEVIYSAIRLDDGRIGMFCEALHEHKLDPDALRSAQALDHTSVMITMYTSTGESLYRNPASRYIACCPGEKMDEHFATSEIIEQLKNTTEEEINTVGLVRTANGLRWHDITARRCLDAVSGDHAWLLSEVDVSALKETEEKAQFLADHDTLTKLPNRHYVTNKFQSHIDALLKDNKTGALIFIDLDHFKDVNDSQGHAAGDELLTEVADRLKSIGGERDLVARLGGDEFLMLVRQSADRRFLEAYSNRVKELISSPIKIQGRQIRVTPSIGICMFPDNGVEIQDLMRHADLAMYHSKASGRNGYALFTQDMGSAVEKRINLESELIVALQKGQFDTYFQPRVNVLNNEIIGAEALVRWSHPTRGMIFPGDFIPACEASGLIGELGRIVLDQSVRAQREWAQSGFDIDLSVNLSPMQFREASLVDDIVSIVNSQQSDSGRIELEITESVLLGHDQDTIDKLHQLVAQGFRIAIDDFGTGYSNLAYLHRYPIGCLKIDRSFVQEIETAQPIVELIISMAKLFNMEVVAEGVETSGQLDALRSYGCQQYQGYLFEKPINFESFSALLHKSQLPKAV